LNSDIVYRHNCNTCCYNSILENWWSPASDKQPTRNSDHI